VAVFAREHQGGDALAILRTGWGDGTVSSAPRSGRWAGRHHPVRRAGSGRAWWPGSAPSRRSASTASTFPAEAARRRRREAMKTSLRPRMLPSARDAGGLAPRRTKRASLVSHVDARRALTETRISSRASQTLNRPVTRRTNVIPRSDERGADILSKGATRWPRRGRLGVFHRIGAPSVRSRASRPRRTNRRRRPPRVQSSGVGGSVRGERTVVAVPVATRRARSGRRRIGEGRPGPSGRGSDGLRLVPPRLVLAAQDRIRVPGPGPRCRYVLPVRHLRACSRRESHPGPRRPPRGRGNRFLTVGAIAARRARHAAHPRPGVSARSDHPRAVLDAPPVACASTTIPANPGRPVVRSRVPSPRGDTRVNPRPPALMAHPVVVTPVARVLRRTVVFSSPAPPSPRRD
jgi:hypothetical protein